MKTKRTYFFLALFALLFTALFGMMLHAVSHREETTHIQNVAAVLQLPPPAFSAHWIEPRIRVYRDYSDHLYPTMHPIDYLGFVYAK